MLLVPIKSKFYFYNFGNFGINKPKLMTMTKKYI